jgi:hypothetical protein
VKEALAVVTLSAEIARKARMKLALESIMWLSLKVW